MKFIERKVLKQKPGKDEPLGFGHYFTDYMFTMKYTKEKGWHDPQIEPNEPVKFDLATTIIHYAQGMFEGMKEFIQPYGSIAVFRPEVCGVHEGGRRSGRKGLRSGALAGRKG